MREKDACGGLTSIHSQWLYSGQVACPTANPRRNIVKAKMKVAHEKEPHRSERGCRDSPPERLIVGAGICKAKMKVAQVKEATHSTVREAAGTVLQKGLVCVLMSAGQRSTNRAAAL